MDTCLSNNDALERFETIWNYVECGIAIVDAETREVLDINPVAARMFGADKAEIVGKRCHKFICPADECSCPIMDRGQVVDRSERVFVRADGTTLPIVKSVAKVQYKGRLALLESFTDISKLKEAEERLRVFEVEERASRAKSDFLSRMSHEMRTPMNAIIGMTRIADKTEDVGKLKYCISMIKESASHLLALINDVLDMSKIEAGKFDLEKKPFNLERMLARISRFVVEKNDEKSVRFDVRIDVDMRACFVGDELRLSQVLTNLLSNAVKFTPDGGEIRLSVETVDADRGGAHLRFVVADTGIGMTEEQLGKLFHAFSQADESISRRFGGTGLGLAISKSIVDKMEGSIGVRSAPGDGSTFTVDVRLPQASDDPLPNPYGRKPEEISILVADDDARTREALARIAERYGLRADEAEDCARAVGRATAARDAGAPYDIVFLSQRLPDADGVAAARALDGLVAPCALTMIAPFSSWNDIDARARDAGVRRFVTRPLFPSAVIGAVSEALGEATQDGGAPQAQPDVAPDFSHLHILLAEDLDINREIFRALLEPTGAQIDTAENGREAVDMFAADPGRYDLLVLDMQMPEMGGCEAAQAIRAMGTPAARAVPMIAMTANVFREDIAKCIASGMNDHIGKPVDDKKLIDKIRLFCGTNAKRAG